MTATVEYHLLKGTGTFQLASRLIPTKRGVSDSTDAPVPPFATCWRHPVNYRTVKQFPLPARPSTRLLQGLTVWAK